YTTYGDAGNGNMFPANGMYLVTEKGAVLFDTPWDTTQFQLLLDSIKARHNKNVIMCISTHFHDDWTAGLNYYKQKGIATYTTKQTDELSKVNHDPRAQYLIYRDTTFHIGQYTFETFYPGKGHSPDNIVIWFGKEKILYGGCFIKSTETNSLGNLADADTDEWIISAKKVKAKFNKPEYIPGHQSWEDKNSLRHTLKLLEQAKRKNKG
ncbi:MAG: subclass B1 metallo-beta-lactamase, partial [Sphingobacteriales bacterium]